MMMDEPGRQKWKRENSWQPLEHIKLFWPTLDAKDRAPAEEVLSFLICVTPPRTKKCWVIQLVREKNKTQEWF